MRPDTSAASHRRKGAREVVNVAIMGAGSWGTTLAKVFADAGNTVALWARRPELAAAIQQTRINSDYLPDITLPPAVTATDDAADALANAAIVVFAVPSQTMRDNLTDWTPMLPADATLVSISKGVEKDTYLRMSEVIAEATGVDPARIAVLSGPNLAHEIAEEQPAATVIACADEKRAKLVQTAVATPYLRPYTNTDVVGVELGGACKNVIALACGVAAGLGFGENTLATIVTRGLADGPHAVAGDADGHDVVGLRVEVTHDGAGGHAGDLVFAAASPVDDSDRDAFCVTRVHDGQAYRGPTPPSWSDPSTR